MAQYCYYTNADSSSANKITKVGYNNTTYRKIGYNGTVFYLHSYWSASANNFPYTTNKITEKTVRPNAPHTYTEFSYSSTYKDPYNTISGETGTSRAYETYFNYYLSNDATAHASDWDYLTLSATMSMGTFIFTDADTYIPWYKTLRFQAYGTGTETLQSRPSRTEPQTVEAGVSSKNLTWKDSTTAKPNNGSLAPVTGFFPTEFQQQVSGKTTTKYSVNDVNTTKFTWNTW